MIGYNSLCFRKSIHKIQGIPKNPRHVLKFNIHASNCRVAICSKILLIMKNFHHVKENDKSQTSITDRTTYLYVKFPTYVYFSISFDTATQKWWLPGRKLIALVATWKPNRNQIETYLKIVENASLKSNMRTTYDIYDRNLGPIFYSLEQNFSSWVVFYSNPY